MNEENTNQKKERRQFSDEFKDQVLLRAEKDGVAQVAKDLGIKESLIYYCDLEKNQVALRSKIKKCSKWNWRVCVAKKSD